AAAIAAQGLLRLGAYLADRGQAGEKFGEKSGEKYWQAGLRVLDTLIDPGGHYLSVDPRHHGLLLHSVYYRPGGWGPIPSGARPPRGESSQWGDYHLREAALYAQRAARGEQTLAFFAPSRTARQQV